MDIFFKCLRLTYQKDIGYGYYPNFRALLNAGLKIDEDCRQKNEREAGSSSSSFRYNKAATGTTAKAKESSSNQINAIGANAPVNLAKEAYSSLPFTYGNEKPKGSGNLIRDKLLLLNALFTSPRSAVFQVLVKAGKLKPMEGYQPRMMHDKWNHSKHCDYHQFSRHTTDECLNLKYKIQDFLDEGVIEKPRPTPNVVNNPLPNNKLM